MYSLIFAPARSTGPEEALDAPALQEAICCLIVVEIRVHEFECVVEHPCPRTSTYTGNRASHACTQVLRVCDPAHALVVVAVAPYAHPRSP